MLIPNSLDPAARGRKMPVPDERPSEKIAKLFPQVDPLKDQTQGREERREAARGLCCSGAKDAAQRPQAARDAQLRQPRRRCETGPAAGSAAVDGAAAGTRAAIATVIIASTAAADETSAFDSIPNCPRRRGAGAA